MRRVARRLAHARLLLAVALLAASMTAVLSVRGFAAGLPVSSTDLTVTARSETVPTQTCSLVATADAYVDEQSSLSNYGLATDLRVGAKVGQRKRAYVAYDVSSCAIPSSGAVASASLRLTIGTAPPSARTYDVTRLTSTFNEMALTWGGTQPTSAAAPTSSVSTGTSAGATLEWDVTADVRSAVTSSPTSCGWTVSDSEESAGAALQTTFRTREYAAQAQRPTLQIRYYA